MYVNIPTIESLSVYNDYIQTLSFLRASRNRVCNTVETAKLAQAQAQQCLQLIEQLYDSQIQAGVARLAALHEVLSVQRDAKAAAKAAALLHEHNRETARLSRVFEADVANEHPEPDEDYDPDKPPKAVDPTVPIDCSKFLDKLQGWSASRNKN